MSVASHCKPVLYAEDNENDALLLKLAFEQVGIENPLVIASNGEEAIDYLQRNRQRSQQPCLLITDLGMPKVDGFGVLRWFFSRRELSEVPVFVLSSSEEERQRVLSLGASRFFTKARLPHLVEVVAQTNGVSLRRAQV